MGSLRSADFVISALSSRFSQSNWSMEEQAHEDQLERPGVLDGLLDLDVCQVRDGLNVGFGGTHVSEDLVVELLDVRLVSASVLLMSCPLGTA